jgi:hypothetical protein
VKVDSTEQLHWFFPAVMPRLTHIRLVYHTITNFLTPLNHEQFLGPMLFHMGNANKSPVFHLLFSSSLFLWQFIMKRGNSDVVNYNEPLKLHCRSNFSKWKMAPPTKIKPDPSRTQLVCPRGVLEFLLRLLFGSHQVQISLIHNMWRVSFNSRLYKDKRAIWFRINQSIIITVCIFY